MSTQSDKAAAFVRLRQKEGAFVIPNPWDAGTARVLEGTGFEALATTSSGFARSIGRVDDQVTLDEKVAHCAALCEATPIPISADLEQLCLFGACRQVPLPCLLTFRIGKAH